MSSIRTRTDDDIAACIEVLRLVYAKDGYPVQGTDNADEMLKNEQLEHAWIAEQDGRIVGHIAVSKPTEFDAPVRLWRMEHPEEPLAVLGKLFVHPDQRGTGTATRLIQTALIWAGETKQRLVLFALDKDQAAIRLYGRLGWISFGTANYRLRGNQLMDAICFASPDSI